MQTNSDRNRTMSNAATLTRLTRTAAKELVAREERNTGSRMAAYDRIASMIGASEHWLRKFVSGYETGLPLVTGYNILSLYESWCSRVDEKIQQEREQIAALRQEINAATPKAFGMVASSPSPQKTGEVA